MTAGPASGVCSPVMMAMLLLLVAAGHLAEVDGANPTAPLLAVTGNDPGAFAHQLMQTVSMVQGRCVL